MLEPDDDKTRTHVRLVNGRMVSHYRIIEKIGAGGIGEVHPYFGARELCL
jgi:hypothetical protein